MVILRSDGRPVYNFASPVDDWVDEITHVIRGDDHVSNTPKQIVVLEALGRPSCPVYAHAPNIFGDDGKKLSKRHGAQSIAEFRDAGYIAPALMNFLALLGWAPDGETTIMSRDELDRAVHAGAGGGEPGHLRLREARLDERPVPARPRRRGVRRRARHLPARAGERVGRGADSGRGADRAGEDRAGSASSRTSPASSSRTCEPDPSLLDAQHPHRGRRRISRDVEPWDAATLEDGAEGALRAPRARSRGPSICPIRVAVTGSRISPGLYESLELLGRETSLARLRRGAALAAGEASASAPGSFPPA